MSGRGLKHARTTQDLAAEAVQRSRGLVIVEHGSNAALARPAGIAVVYWFGTVEPENGIAGDLWYDTTP